MKLVVNKIQQQFIANWLHKKEKIYGQLIGRNMLERMKTADQRGHHHQF